MKTFKLYINENTIYSSTVRGVLIDIIVNAEYEGNYDAWRDQAAEQLGQDLESSGEDIDNIDLRDNIDGEDIADIIRSTYESETDEEIEFIANQILGYNDNHRFSLDEIIDLIKKENIEWPEEFKTLEFQTKFTNKNPRNILKIPDKFLHPTVREKYKNIKTLNKAGIF